MVKSKILSIVMALCVAATTMFTFTTSASAEKRTLSADLNITGYTNAVLYDFQNNDPEVLPTTGDLRYRQGGTWGLHNFGSGTRSATVSVPVKENGLLVLQNYAGKNAPTINRGTLNSALSTSTGYQVYDITADADDVQITVERYNGVVAAVTMEKDSSVATANYTVRYLGGDQNEVKESTVSSGIVGAQPVIDTSDFVDDSSQKWIYVSDDSANKTIASDGSTIVTVTYRKASTFSYKVNAVYGETTNLLAAGQGFEGDSVTVGYPVYANVKGTLYTKAATNKEYRMTVALDEDNKIVNLEYTATDITNVVYYSEGENLEGATVVNTGNASTRSSNAAAAYPETNDIVLTTLPAGKYKVTATLYSPSSAGGDLKFTLGDNNINFTSDNSNATTTTSDELEIEEDTDLVFLQGGNTNNALDYIYVVKTSVDPVLKDAAEAAESFALTDYAAGTVGAPTFAGLEARLTASKVIKIEIENPTADVHPTVTINGGEPVALTADMAVAGESSTVYYVAFKAETDELLKKFGKVTFTYGTGEDAQTTTFDFAPVAEPT